MAQEELKQKEKEEKTKDLHSSSLIKLNQATEYVFHILSVWAMLIGTEAHWESALWDRRHSSPACSHDIWKPEDNKRGEAVLVLSGRDTKRDSGRQTRGGGTMGTAEMYAPVAASQASS
ncbi:hypothetical protein AAFF_G00225080 [Aldrovandia affinis]|uniref:Uncharacterized protein n=1 Tax=Aldrovandia affinis TaxID=143900 RepID=A0AAD7TB25_9TELE|nr:hypothetical protein AAFF_G00225080 [Aldrovandia affinis]